MAIKKKLQSNTGAPAEYHRVLAVGLNAIDRSVTITVASYFTQEARAAGLDPIDSTDIEVPAEDYGRFLKGPAFDEAYSWLKENVVGFEESENA